MQLMSEVLRRKAGNHIDSSSILRCIVAYVEDICEIPCDLDERRRQDEMVVTI